MARVVSHREHPDPFVRFPRHLLENPTLSLKAKALLAWMLDKGDYPDGWETEVARICAVTSDGKAAVRGAMAELQLAGYLERLDEGVGGRGKRTEWHVFDQAKGSENRMVSEDLSPEIELSESENRDLTPHNRETSSSKTTDVRFSAFWDACLRKEAKREAEKAFGRALKRTDLTGIMIGQAVWNAYWRAERTPVKFVPLPASWLNGDRFNDKPPPVLQKAKRSQDLTDAEFRALAAQA